MILAIILGALFFSGLPCGLYFRNIRLFRRPASAGTDSRPQVSVLVPARNEEAGIAAALDAILSNEGVALEVIVLDDHSTDRTAEIVRSVSARDPRVRIELAPPLPDGWCGKQYACFHLSSLAKFEIITFLDADVRLSPVALARMVGFLQSSGAALVSSFPRQYTGCFGEAMIVPLIHWLLLSYLPLDRMRQSLQPGLGAGCGQWFLTTATAYRRVGGHGHPLVRGSLHDGVKLPRAYRLTGLKTDLCDGHNDAICRMYSSSIATWNGFAKNAREGLGAPGSIWIWTVLLSFGHILPFALLPVHDSLNPYFSLAILLACGLSLAPRIHAAIRFQQSWLGVVLHPIAIIGLLAIQWFATVRVWLGRPVGWKGRTPPTLPSNATNTEALR